MRKVFSYRALTTYILAWTFFALIVSGVMLYVSPPGRIANWNNWTLLALTKSQWAAVHILTAITFLVGGMFHLLKFNWKVFWAYLTKRGEVGFRFGKELAVSVAIFKAENIAALPGDTLRNIAGKNNMKPFEVVDLLKKQ